MSEEKKSAPLSDEELDKVAGGYSYWPDAKRGIGQMICPNCLCIFDSPDGDVTCPVCGAETSLDPATGKLTCPTCGWKNG